MIILEKRNRRVTATRSPWLTNLADYVRAVLGLKEGTITAPTESTEALRNVLGLRS
jgi:hypothetical protein